MENYIRFSHFRNGSGSGTSIFHLVTNCPSAVIMGQILPKEDCDGHRTEKQLFSIDYSKLFDGAFIAITEDFDEEWAGRKKGTKFFKCLVGNADETTLFFGSAYKTWAEQMKEEAVGYISRQPGFNKAMRCDLLFAAGLKHKYAGKAQRIPAWRSVLRRLNITGERQDRIVNSIWTVHVKAALSLGWKPSVKQPAFWEGLPDGVVALS